MFPNNKIQVTEVVGGYGIQTMQSMSQNSSFINGQNVTIETATTAVSLDASMVSQCINNEMMNPNSNISVTVRQRTQDQILDLLKNHIRLEVIAWHDPEKPTFTCMVLLDEHVIAEKDFG